MASKRRAPLFRKLPGFFDVRTTAFVQKITRLAMNGTIAHLDALRMLSHAVVAKDAIRIAEWALNNLVVPAGKTTRPGPIVLTRMQAATADLFQDPTVSQITYLKNPRIGASFLIAAVMIYFSAHENKPVMFYDRAMKNSRNFYEEKFEAIFQASPRIRDLLPEEKNSADRQRWSDRTLTTGAGARFRSVSDKIKSDMAAVAFADEAGDIAYRNRGDNKEGSKIDLIRARVQEFSEGKVFVGGTPTTLGECSVSEEFEKSNKCEWRMTFDCCDNEGEFVTDVREVPKPQSHLPQGPGLRYTTNGKGKVEDVWYECEFCSVKIPETRKIALMDTGWWAPTNPDGEPGHYGVRSWMIHSQDPKATWMHIAAAHLAAVSHPDKLQSFTNLFLAKVWQPPTLKTIEPHELMDRRVVFTDGKLPKWVKFLFAGIDSQAGIFDRPDKPARHETVVIGIGENMRWCVVAHDVVDFQEIRDATEDRILKVPIVPFSNVAAEKMWKFLDTQYQTEDGRTLQVVRTCCDVGWAMEDATRFVNMPGSRQRRITAVRGASEAAGRLPAIAPGPDKGFVFEKTGVRVHKLGTQTVKDYVFNTLAFFPPAPQSWTLPDTVGEAFFKSLLAEKLVELPSGRMVWRPIDKTKETGEVLDCIVYAYCACMMERRWTIYGRDVIEPTIAISVRAVEEALEAEAERQVLEVRAAAAPKLPAPSISAPDMTEPPPNPEPPPQETVFEIIRDYTPGDQTQHPTRTEPGVFIIGRG